MDENLKYELVKYRHQDQAKLSLHISDTDFKVFSGYLTLQVALCSFIIYKAPGMSFVAKIGFSLIDIVLAWACFKLLRNHWYRRKEIVETIKNCNEYLGYNEVGFYLKDKAINGKTVNRFWFGTYTVVVIAACVAFQFILFANNITSLFVRIFN